MIGSILGDIAGSLYEFTGNRDPSVRLFLPESHFTDDTLCTIAVADALINNLDPAKTMKKWVAKYPDLTYGDRFRRWARGELVGSSFGNGSAMRISPVAFKATSEDELRQWVYKFTVFTHGHPEGLKGAMATALAIYYARRGQSKNLIREKMESEFGYDLNPSIIYLREHYEFDETCQGTVPEALICFLESNSFEECLINAASIGGDADTLGAIAGGVAEAYYGVPKDLQNLIPKYLPEEMNKVVAQFVTRYHDR